MHAGRERKRVILVIYLVFLYLLHAQSFTRFQGVSCETKRIILVVPREPADTKRKFYDAAHFSLFMT